MSTEQLRTEYAQVKDRAQRFCSALQSQLLHLIEQNNITLAVPLEGRVKTWDSIEEKIARKSLQLRNISDLDDLVGTRIIVLFRKDLDAMDRLLHRSVAVEQSEDTSARLSESQFGYQSLHYIARFPDPWLAIPTHQEYEGMRAEVQIRTVAQHIWAASSHKLQYKSENSVPVPLRRSIYRVSALLETVDLEFERLLQERQAYVADQVASTSTDDDLNVDIVEHVLSELLPAKNRKGSEDYADLLVDLLHFKVATEANLRALLKTHLPASLREDAAIAKRRNKSFFYSHVGLARNALRYAVGDKEVSDFHEIKKRQRAPRQ